MPPSTQAQPAKTDASTPCAACSGTMKIKMVEPADADMMKHTFVCACGASAAFQFPRAAGR